MNTRHARTIALGEGGAWAFAGNVTDQMFLNNALQTEVMGGEEGWFAINNSKDICNRTMTINDLGIRSNNFIAKIIESAGRVKMDSTVNYTATDSIVLRVGFTVEAGSAFTAKIDNCTPSSLHQPLPAIFRQATTMERDKKTNRPKLSVFPNPTVASFVVETEASGQLFIFDTNGQLLQERPLGNQLTVSVADWTSGTYYLVFKNEKGELMSEKVLKVD